MTFFNKMSAEDEHSMKADVVAGLVCIAIVAVGWVLFDIIETFGELEPEESRPACGRYDYCPPENAE